MLTNAINGCFLYIASHLLCCILLVSRRPKLQQIVSSAIPQELPCHHYFFQVFALVATAFAGEQQPAKRGVVSTGSYGLGAGYLGASSLGLTSPYCYGAGYGAGYGVGHYGALGGIPTTQTVSQINQAVGVVAPVSNEQKKLFSSFQVIT